LPYRSALVKLHHSWKCSKGPIDLNKASKEDLVSLPGIGPVLAERIIAARPFHSVDDLSKVSGIGPKKFEDLRQLVIVQPEK
jgi:competence protein ComEA